MLEIKNIIITPEILKLVAEIDEFKGRWQVLENLAPERLSALEKIATIESAGSSTRIEGAKLTDAEVEALFSRLKTTSFASRDEQEVAGYVDAMETLFENYNDLVITENHIRQLHGILLKYSSKDYDHRGEYKKTNIPILDNSAGILGSRWGGIFDPVLTPRVGSLEGKTGDEKTASDRQPKTSGIIENGYDNVEAFGADGKSLGVIFQTATPFETPLMMKDLVEWYNGCIVEAKQHPLLLIAIFIVTFLAIHPFKDGNGRLSRILTTLLLLRAGYHYVPYSSMESIIEANKDTYYLALRRTQQTIREPEQNWEAWLICFLKTMVKQKNNLADKVKEEQALRDSLPALSRQIMGLAKTRGEISVKEIEVSTGANRNTIKAHLKKLTDLHYLESSGQGRGVTYRIV